MLQLTSYVRLCRQDCMAGGSHREQALERGEERGLPGLRTGQPEQWLSAVRAEDRPIGEERGPEGPQGPERGLPEAPLELADQGGQEADEAQRRLGPREAPGAEPVGPEGVREFLHPILAVGAAIVRPPHRLRGERKGGHDGVEPVPGDLEERPAKRGGPDRPLLAHHDEPPRPSPPLRLEDQLGDLEAGCERPEGEPLDAGLQEAREPGGDGVWQRGRLQGDEDRLVEAAAVCPNKGDLDPAPEQRQHLGKEGRRAARGGGVAAAEPDVGNAPGLREDGEEGVVRRPAVLARGGALQGALLSAVALEDARVQVEGVPGQSGRGADPDTTPEAARRSSGWPSG